MLRRRLSRTLLTAAIALAALGWSACGDDPPSTDSTATETTTASAPADGPVSETRAAFEKQLRAFLAERAGGSLDVDCTIELLRETVSDEQLEAAVEAQAETGEVPEETIDAAFEAGRECG